MIPVIANRGTSFAGAFAYYCHDKQAWSTERVAWTECLNLMTDSVEKAWKRMAYTAMHQKELKRAAGQRMTGAKMQKPVFCYSLSWHPEQNPSQQLMMEAVIETLKALGLIDHQAIVAAHHDEPHPHVHVMVNAVHPITGLVARLKNTKRKLSKFALNYERKEGKLYCPKREENHARNEAGLKAKHCDPVLLEAWKTCSDASEFTSKLEVRGYQLAQGRRLVVVDPHGNVINPVRALGIRAKEFKEKIQDLDTNEIPTLEDVLRRRQTLPEPLEVNPDLENIQAEISELKSRLRKSGILSKLFGLDAYRKHRLVRMRQQFRAVAAGSSCRFVHQEPNTG